MERCAEAVPEAVWLEWIDGIEAIYTGEHRKLERSL